MDQEFTAWAGVTREAAEGAGSSWSLVFVSALEIHKEGGGPGMEHGRGAGKEHSQGAGMEPLLPPGRQRTQDKESSRAKICP